MSTPLGPAPETLAAIARGAMIDRRLCLLANRLGSKHSVTVLFAMVSRLGDGVFWYGLMITLGIFGGRRGALAAGQMVVTGLLALTLYRSIKRWTHRPRPYIDCPGVAARIAPLDEFSFPSGHTLQAVSFTIVALAWYPALTPLLLSFTGLVALSRVVLGLHYPSDVLAAIAIGGLLGSGSLCLSSGL